MNEGVFPGHKASQTHVVGQAAPYREVSNEQLNPQQFADTDISILSFRFSMGDAEMRIEILNAPYP